VGASLGLPLRFPAAHPFNPLHHLRLAIACGSKPEADTADLRRSWTTARSIDPAGLQSL
jgi:hypothetical protein